MYELFIDVDGVLALYEALQTLMPVSVISEHIVPIRNKTTQPILRAFLPSERAAWIKNGNAPPKLLSPMALWGVHPCMLRAQKLVDAVFLDLPTDIDYRATREQVFFVGFDCFAPRESCFCNSFGENAFFDATACDITFGKTDMGFLVRAKTIVAQQLIMDCGARTATINELASWEEIRNQTVELLNKNQRFKSYAQTGKSISHGSEFFIDKEILSRCTQCGSCTRACPCCFCFTLHDEATSRSLHANSCMMHHVNNDIVTKLFEQRLRHKFVYLPTRYGSIGCTGCGECIDACVAQIDFRDILNMIFRK